MFTKCSVVVSRHFQWLSCALLALTFAGCATSPKERELTDEEIAATLDENGDPTFIALPNPYLQQEVKVPAEAAALFSDALAVMEERDWAEAEMRFTEITQTYPSLSGPWVNLGISRWKQEQFETASQAFDKAIEVNPLNVDAYNTYGVMAREQGEFAKAEALYLQAIQVWPHSPVSHRNLGVLYDMYMGRFDEALNHFEMASKVGAKPDKQLKGWMIDIKRRQAKMAREAAKQQPVTQPAEQVQQAPAGTAQ